MPEKVAKQPYHLAQIYAQISAAGFPVRVSWHAGHDRSLEQNRTQFMWAKEAAKWLGDTTPDEVRASWKVDYGASIRAERDLEFRSMWDDMVRPFPRDTQIRMVRVLDIPVTRNFLSGEMTRYMEMIQEECALAGIPITIPDGRHA